MAEKVDIEIYLVIDNDGGFAVADNEEDAIQQYNDNYTGAVVRCLCIPFEIDLPEIEKMDKIILNAAAGTSIRTPIQETLEKIREALGK